MKKIQVAVLDDYQSIARTMADWSEVDSFAGVTVFTDHLSGAEAVVERLKPFDVVCIMRERTPLTAAIIQQLPALKLIVSTGARNASLDADAAGKKGIAVRHTGYVGTGAPELTWALLMGIAKNIVTESRGVQTGGWQTGVSADLSGRTLGLVGLGKIGQKMAQYAKVFDMKVIAWSPNLDKVKAASAGVMAVTKDELFRNADFVSIHMVLSEKTAGLVGKEDLEKMKATAYLINTSRGPLVDEPALIETLRQNRIAGAALDVFDTEPLPAGHPFRTFPNVLATPHTGYGTFDTYQVFFADMVRAITDWNRAGPGMAG